MRDVFSPSLRLIVLVCVATASAVAAQNPPVGLKVMSFNILQGGGNAANVGFPDSRFGGSRYDDLAKVIHLSGAEIVGVQEDDQSGRLLKALGKGWQHEGTIYSRFELESIRKGKWLSIARVKISESRSIIVVNCHWSPAPYGPYLIQDFIRKQGTPSDLGKFESEILKSSDKTNASRGYTQAMEALAPFLKAGENVFLTGDFNEPSHLDWTELFAANGADRWVRNPTKTPLRFVVRWRGSRLLLKSGMKDAYRTAFPDVVKHPGNTWTPVYAEKVRGRRPYGDQVLDRIDMIYFSGKHLTLKDAAVVGESAKGAELVYKGDWPSDHRAVLAAFSLEP